MLYRLSQLLMMTATRSGLYQLEYNKNLKQYRTNIVLAGYRYSTSGFYSLSLEVF